MHHTIFFFCRLTNQQILIKEQLALTREPIIYAKGQLHFGQINTNSEIALKDAILRAKRIAICQTQIGT